MIHKALSLGIAFFLTLGMVPAALADQVFQDNFQTLDPAWGTLGQASAGIYTLKALQDGNRLSLYNSLVFTNMDASVDVCMQKFTNMGFAYGGLAFWAVDLNNDYELSCTADGYFQIVRYVAGRQLKPVNFTKTSALKQGLGQWNQLRVVTKGNQATCFVNGVQVAQITGQPPEGGGEVGFSVNQDPLDGTGYGQFRNLVVHY